MVLIHYKKTVNAYRIPVFSVSIQYLFKQVLNSRFSTWCKKTCICNS